MSPSCGDGSTECLLRSRDSPDSDDVPAGTPTRIDDRSAIELTMPCIRFVVSVEVMPAVNTAIAITEVTIQIIAMMRPGNVTGTMPPAARCVIVWVDHHTPDENPRTPPRNPSLVLRSNSQLSAPAPSARPSKVSAACPTLHDAIARITGSQFEIRSACTATPVPA